MLEAPNPGRAALEDLARHASPALRRLAARYVGGPDAEDAVQDAYVRLLAAGPTVRHAGRFLAVATSTLALDRIRRNRLRAGRGQEGTLERLPDEAPDPEAAAASRREVRRLARALAELPDPCRQALLLSRVEGLTHLAIAARLRLSPKTVERHILRALRHCLARRGAG